MSERKKKKPNEPIAQNQRNNETEHEIDATIKPNTKMEKTRRTGIPNQTEHEIKATIKPNTTNKTYQIERPNL